MRSGPRPPTDSLSSTAWHTFRSCPELLYMAAMFHDVGLLAPFSEIEQRFEVDGADHARQFLLRRGFSVGAAETVWTAIALHTTPGIPGRMAPLIAMTQLGVLTDMLGLPHAAVDGSQQVAIGGALVHVRGCAQDGVAGEIQLLEEAPSTRCTTRTRSPTSPKFRAGSPSRSSARPSASSKRSRRWPRFQSSPLSFIAGLQRS
ncbi:HD domain-containing protein [Promicromonospora sp. NPDC090134]|uniref:HD domain-containing protein n=1 Tax=Promicromonospora sp. NPDC090134 TaxID=3364408 RepID=UPI00382F719A